MQCGPDEGKSLPKFWIFTIQTIFPCSFGIVDNCGQAWVVGDVSAIVSQLYVFEGGCLLQV